MSVIALVPIHLAPAGRKDYGSYFMDGAAGVLDRAGRNIDWAGQAQ
jgi:hypothetical protein